MELTNNDRQRILIAAGQYPDNPVKFTDIFFVGAEYATIYERQQQAELRNKVIDDLWNALVKKGYGNDLNILATFHSFKTK